MEIQNFEQQVVFYHNVFVYCAVAALIFLVIAVVLFFLLKIPKVFGEFTGRDAKRAIEEMMAENALSGSLTSLKLGEDGRRRRRGRTGSLATGRLRKNTIVRTGNLKMDSTESLNQNNLTDQLVQNTVSGNLSENNNGQQDNFGSAETDVLDTFGSAETDVLDTFGSAETDVLKPVEETGKFPATEPVLMQPSSETVVLNQEMRQMNDEFVILRSIVDIHTDEVV